MPSDQKEEEEKSNISMARVIAWYRNERSVFVDGFGNILIYYKGTCYRYNIDDQRTLRRRSKVPKVLERHSNIISDTLVDTQPLFHTDGAMYYKYGTYWKKTDFDYRENDLDTLIGFPLEPVQPDYSK